MGLHFVILAIEGDRPLKVPLLVLGAFLVLYGLMSVGYKIWLNRGQRRFRKRLLENWTPLAQARGFEIDASGEQVVMRGTVASRPFVLDPLNWYGYGMDTENALRFQVEDVEASFSITGWDAGWPTGNRQPPVGDDEFDKRYQIRADDAGLRWIARFGPNERRLLFDFELAVDQMKGNVRIRMPYRIDAAHMDAACRLVESVWGSPPSATSAA